MNKKDIKRIETHSVYPIVKDTLKARQKEEQNQQNKLRQKFQNR